MTAPATGLRAAPTAAPIAPGCRIPITGRGGSTRATLRRPGAPIPARQSPAERSSSQTRPTRRRLPGVCEAHGRPAKRAGGAGAGGGWPCGGWQGGGWRGGGWRGAGGGSRIGGGRAGTGGGWHRRGLQLQPGGVPWRLVAGQPRRGERRGGSARRLAAGVAADGGGLRTGRASPTASRRPGWRVRLPARTSRSTAGSAARTAASVRRRSRSRSRTIAHIQSTCCVDRFAASSPCSSRVARWRVTADHTSSSPAPLCPLQASTGARQYGRIGAIIRSAPDSSRAAARAGRACSPSALLTAMTSAISRMPFLIPCRLSPVRAIVSSRNVSTIAATATSDCPTPTVSTRTMS